MIIDPKKGSSISPDPEEPVEFSEVGTVIPLLFPTLKRQTVESRVHLQFFETKSHESISVDLPTEIAYELANKMNGECFAWRAKALEQHEGECVTFLVIYRYVGTVRVVGRGGVAQQMAELGVEPDGNFAMRIARSEPGELDFTNFMHITLPDYELGNLARQIEFVAKITEV